MVNSEVSGIAFSVHPVTEDRNQLIIEAGFGLGEAIVSGQVTPDSYVVEKEPRRIIDTNISTQSRALYRVKAGGNEWIDIPEPKASSQVLTEKQILEFADLIMRIENHYGFPCDIEWAFEKNKFYITQSRPITTLNKVKTTSSDKDKVTLVKNTDCQIDWSNANSLFHYSIAAGGYFNNFNKLFGKNISFVYLSYVNGVASAYLPTNEYETLGLYLAEKSREGNTYQNWIIDFKKSADDIRELFLTLTPLTFFDNIEQIKATYNNYTPRQVAIKTASNFLTKETDRHIFEQFELARKYSETLFLDNNKLVVASLEEVVKKTNGKYTLKQLMFGTVDEVARIYNGDLFIQDDELNKRFKRCGVFSFKEGLIIFAQSWADEIETTWSSAGGEDQVKGNSAYPGTVTGICRIIKDYKNADINDGEILVTGMTDPNFVQLIKKAKAIVTDGGGLLCHAAIISRELKKPCIIGTKIATQVLKDGDLVEVDAERGIVKIIERGPDNS